MVIELLNGGNPSPATGAVSICWAGGSVVRLDFQITTAGTDDDCITNFDTGGSGCNNVALASAGIQPCDFVGVLFDATLMDLAPS
jgi:hypothetical protein